VAVSHRGAGITIDLPGVFVLANTVIAPADAMNNGIALWLGELALNTTVSGNILAGADSHSIGLQVDCATVPDVPIAVSFHDNLVFGAGAALLHYDGCPATSPVPTSYGSMDDMSAALLAAGGAASGNVTIAPPACPPTADGGTDLGCIAACAAGDGGCFDTLFAGWDNATLGVQNLFGTQVFDGGCPAAVAPPSGDGWPLATNGGVPCQILRSPPFDASLPPSDGGEAGAFMDAGAVTQDIYGNCRPSSSPSMGAAQAPSDAACLP
jgi:hypothetical protein